MSGAIEAELQILLNDKEVKGFKRFEALYFFLKIALQILFTKAGP